MGDGGGPVTAGESAQRMADEMTRKAAVARAQVRLLEKNAEAWAAGAHGERLVATALAGYELDGRVLHDRLLRPGLSQVNLDHVIVSNAGVFVLDTKNWTGDLSVHQDRLWVRRVGSDGKPHLAPDKGLAKVGGYASEMALLLGVQVRPLVVLANDIHAGFAPRAVGGIDVVPVGRLREWFLRQPAVLDDLQRDLLGLQCDTSFPETSSVARVEAPTGVRAPRAPTPQATRRPAPARPTPGRPAPARPAPARPTSTSSRPALRLAQAAVVGVLLVLGVTQVGRLGPMVSSVVLSVVKPPSIAPVPAPHPSTPTTKKTAPVKARPATQGAQVG